MLGEIIRDIEGRERTLTLVDPPPGLCRELRERFAARQVVVESTTTDGVPAERAVVSEGGERLATVDVAGLEPPLVDDACDALDALRDLLDRRSFSSYDVDQLRATAREIEDRAWRAAAGSIHAGFRTVATLTREADVYAQLATTDLDVHVYAAPDPASASTSASDTGSEAELRSRSRSDARLDAPATADLPDLGDATVHLSRAPELRRTRFVAFDGGDAPTDRCVLLAEPRGDDQFAGVWVYDDDAVDAVVDHLERHYADAAAV
jgi:DICT domain-containing protein